MLPLQVIVKWFLGLVFSLFIGHYAASWVRSWLYSSCKLKEWNRPRKGEGPARVKAWQTGFLERSFFTIVVGLKYPGVLGAMMAWLGLKLGANWAHSILKGKKLVTSYALVALLTGLVSMLFALIGGRFCAGELLTEQFNMIWNFLHANMVVTQ